MYQTWILINGKFFILEKKEKKKKKRFWVHAWGQFFQ